MTAVVQEVERHLRQRETRGDAILFLQFIRDDAKVPSLLPEPSPKVVVNGNPVMHHGVRNQQNLLHRLLDRGIVT